MNGASLISNYPFITSQESDSFARHTLVHRMPFIIEQIIADNSYGPEIIDKLRGLSESIVSDLIPRFTFSFGDMKQSQDRLNAYVGKRWSELPFYFAEVFFYAEILEIVHFSEGKIDPFSEQKKRDLQENQSQLLSMLDSVKKISEGAWQNDARMLELLKLVLWGNKSDLSQLEVNRDKEEAKDMLIDHSKKIVEYLSQGTGRLDIVLDNAGVELFTDLLLAVQLLDDKLVHQVVLHAKAYPTFVSDATIGDIMNLLDFFAASGEPSLAVLAVKVRGMLRAEQLIIRDHPFWNAPLHFYEMPAEVSKDLRASDMTIYKGDLNYRRIFGDRQVPVESVPETLADYLPSKSVAIRILKSELMVGLEKDKQKRLSTEEPEWMVNGRHGIIQYLKQS